MFTNGAVLNGGVNVFDVVIAVKGGKFIFKLSREGKLTPGGKFKGGRLRLEKSGNGAIPETEKNHKDY